MKEAPKKPSVLQKEDSSASESEDSSSDESDSDVEKGATGGIPKGKLAGNVNVKRKRKGRGLRAMFK